MSQFISKVARRYADALYQAVKENPKAKPDLFLADLDKTFHHLVELDAALRAEEAGLGLLEVLRDPDVEAVHKLSVLDSALEGQTKLRELVRNFFAVVVGHDRFGDIEEMIAAFRELVQEDQNKAAASVVSALPLTEPQVERLREQIRTLTGREPELDLAVDSKLIAGVRIEIAGVLYDYSVRGQLDRLTQNLATGVTVG